MIYKHALGTLATALAYDFSKTVLTHRYPPEQVKEFFPKEVPAAPQLGRRALT
jgi:hypothetical protein